MATTPLFLQKTSQDVKVTYQNANINTPIPMNSGSGINSLMEIDTNSIIEYDRTVTGDVSAALLPTKVMGKIHLHPQSPALSQIINVINGYNKFGVLTPGTITVSSDAGGFSYVFTNVVFSTPFGGYNINKTLDDYTFNFEAIPPDLTSLSTLINAAGGAANV